MKSSFISLLTSTIIECFILYFAGVSRAAADLRGDRDSSCELEAGRAGSDPPRLQGVGRPGRLEHRLLPNTEGYHCGRYVRVEHCTDLMVNLNIYPFGE